MSILSFKTQPEFISINNNICIYSKDVNNVDITSHEGCLLQHLRKCSLKGLNKHKHFYLYNNPGYKKLLTYNFTNNVNNTLIPIIRISNLNKWNRLRSQIRKHL